jgi:hypothetical protein
MPIIEEPGVRRGQFIALGGLKKHGKDAFADFLAEDHGYIKLGMSDRLHEIALVLNPWLRLDDDEMHEIETDRFTTYNYLTNLLGYTQAKDIREYREFLQTLGTDVGRQMLDPDIWVIQAFQKIQKLLHEGKNVVLTATRFPNELDMTEHLEGVSLWISRPNLVQPVDTHASENSVSEKDFDHTVLNDGTLEELRSYADSLVRTLTRTKDLGVSQS